MLGNQRENGRNDLAEMLDEQTKKKRDDRHYYRNTVLRSVSAFFIGAILSAFLETFGFGCFLCGLLLCALSALCFCCQ